jgi:hypothetical protein
MTDSMPIRGLQEVCHLVVKSESVNDMFQQEVTLTDPPTHRGEGYINRHNSGCQSCLLRISASASQLSK